MSRRGTRAVNNDPPAEAKTLGKHPPTSADVARLAQVSQATVSLVFNGVGNSRFSAETRERVLSAAEALGYVPHALASNLRSGQSDLVLITFLSLPTGAKLAVYYEQIAIELNALGYTVLFHVDRSLQGTAAARSWASLRPVGLIVDGERLTADAVKVLRKVGVKAIVAIGSKTVASVPAAGLPEDLVGTCAAEYLLSKGYRRPAVVVPKQTDLRPVGLERLRAFEKAVRAHDPACTVEQVDLDLSEEDAANLVAQWKRAPHSHPDAIFAYNDVYAGLLLSAMQDGGLRVPDDIAIMGCDDLLISPFLRPRLTTVRFPIEEWARTMAVIVDSMVHGGITQIEPTGGHVPHVVVRESA